MKHKLLTHKRKLFIKNLDKINQEIQKAYEVIKEGGIILYPTDTVWA